MEGASPEYQSTRQKQSQANSKAPPPKTEGASNTQNTGRYASRFFQKLQSHISAMATTVHTETMLPEAKKPATSPIISNRSKSSKSSKSSITPKPALASIPAPLINKPERVRLVQNLLLQNHTIEEISLVTDMSPAELNFIAALPTPSNSVSRS